MPGRNDADIAQAKPTRWHYLAHAEIWSSNGMCRRVAKMILAESAGAARLDMERLLSEKCSNSRWAVTKVVLATCKRCGVPIDENLPDDERRQLDGYPHKKKGQSDCLMG